MPPLIHNGFVTPCHTLISYQSKPPLYRGLIKYHDYKFDKHKASIVNYKKDKAFFKNVITSMLTDHNYNDNSYFERGNYSEVQQPPIASASILSKYESNVRFMKGILGMTRLKSYLPSIALVLAGGWIGGGHSMQALMRPGQVWIVAGCSGLITMASMLVNDIFDFRSGTDQKNGRTSPLLSGEIHPYHVELSAGCFYGASIIGLCYLDPMSLRLLIGVSIVATYIYTPILKNITMVKNVVVSGIISFSIFAGALATGGKKQLQNPAIIAVALFLFLCVLSQEILMDVGDMMGDKAAGVNTLAVRFGRKIGTLTTSFFLVAANALLESHHTPS